MRPKNESSFLIENSSIKTFFTEKKIRLSSQPYAFYQKIQTIYLRRSNKLLYRSVCVIQLQVVDIHTHLYPSKFKKFYKRRTN